MRLLQRLFRAGRNFRSGGPDAQPPNASSDAPPRHWPLSMPLISWSEHDHFLLRDAYCGCQTFGGTGAGKSSGPVAAVNSALLQIGAGAMYLTCKPDDPAMYLALARACGREKDVIFIGPEHATAYNFMDEISRGGAGAVANLTTLLSIVSGMALGVSAQADREGGTFWLQQDNRLVSSSALVLILAGERLNTVNLERVLLSIPQNREQVADERWQESSYLYQCMRLASARIASADDREDLNRLANYFLKSLPTLNDKTRSTVLSSVGATLDIFNQPVVRRLISSTAPTFDFEMLQAGKILLVEMPVMRYLQQGRLVQMVLKHCFTMCQNRRTASPSTRPVILCCDESQYLVDLEHDGKFFTTARSTGTAVIFSTQSISNYLSAASGGAVEARTHAMLSNLQTQIFCQTTDTKTVEYVQALLGKRKTLYMNSGTQRQGGDWVSDAVGLVGPSGVNAGFSEQLAPLIEADDLHDLAKGGPEFDWTVEGLVYQGGRTFASSGLPYLRARFPQHCVSP